MPTPRSAPNDLDEKATREGRKAAEEAMAHETTEEEITAAKASLATAMAPLEAIRKLRHRALIAGAALAAPPARPVADRPVPP